MATKPYYMLEGQIDLVKEVPCRLNGEEYVERTYKDQNGDQAIIARKSEIDGD